MKPKFKVFTSYKEGDILIRSMQLCDVSTFAQKVGKNPQEVNALKQQMKQRILSTKDDDTDLVLTVLYDGKYYGYIKTFARNVIGTKANVRCYFPTAEELQELNTEIVKCFINFCKNEGLYDEQLFIETFEDGVRKAYIIDTKVS